MSELEFIEKISNMSEKQLECVEDRIYNDCVYYNDCGLCPHKFEIYENMNIFYKNLSDNKMFLYL